jgi:hypothetical protein
METLLQSRRESQAHLLRNESHAGHKQRDVFFYHERLCQYAPYTEQDDLSVLSIDKCRRYITACIWPRLVVIRVKHVLSALMPLLNLADDGTYGTMLRGVSSILSPLGWVLHGLRLLINTLQILQQTIPGEWVNHAEKMQGLYARVCTHVQTHGVAMGNDLIWVLSSIAPATIRFTFAFFVMDILWLSGRAWLEMARLNHLFDSIDATADNILLAELTKEWVFEQRKFLLNLANLVSLSAIAITKNFVLPTILPALALNPLLLLTFSLLSLAITIASHLLGQELARQKQCHASEETDRPIVSGRNSTRLDFFRNPPPLNEEDIRQPINATCAS